MTSTDLAAYFSRVGYEGDPPSEPRHFTSNFSESQFRKHAYCALALPTASRFASQEGRAD